MSALADKVVLVTGAARGIGAATALCCANEGAIVVLCDLDEQGGRETAARIGGKASFVRADIADEESVETLFAGIIAAHGRLDGAVNNAGIEVPLVPVPDVSMADFDRLMRVNLRGTFLCLRAELRIMREQRSGAVVNISSVAGLDGINGSIVYNASKHGVVGMTKCAAMDMGPHGVRVNSIAPGATRTEMADAYFQQIPGALDMVRGMIPMDRIADPSETADAICWLLSDRSSFVSGQTLAVDGGMMAGRIYR